MVLAAFLGCTVPWNCSTASSDASVLSFFRETWEVVCSHRVAGVGGGFGNCTQIWAIIFILHVLSSLGMCVTLNSWPKRNQMIRAALKKYLPGPHPIPPYPTHNIPETPSSPILLCCVYMWYIWCGRVWCVCGVYMVCVCMIYIFHSFLILQSIFAVEIFMNKYMEGTWGIIAMRLTSVIPSLSLRQCGDKMGLLSTSWRYQTPEEQIKSLKVLELKILFIRILTS